MRYILLFTFVISVIFFIEKSIDITSKDSLSNSKESVEVLNTKFDSDLLPTSTSGIMIQHDFYTLSYREDHEQAEWVAYELQRDHLRSNEFERPYFREDPEVRSGSADWRNYKNSGFDRGHLCPAGDRRFSYDAYSETFLTSNISPQNREFNSGIWNFLEQKVRMWAKKYDGVYVITGGVLNKSLPSIGYEEVSVPDQFFKIIFNKSANGVKVIAFLIPNRPTSNSFFNYVEKVDYIEELTGIDFFPQLPDSLEMDLESKIDLKGWGKN